MRSCSAAGVLATSSRNHAITGGEGVDVALDCTRIALPGTGCTVLIATMQDHTGMARLLQHLIGL